MARSRVTVNEAPCPQCRAKGHDRAGDNLHLYSNGGYCHKCGYSTRESVVQAPEQKRDTQAEMQVISQYPIAALPHKLISAETCRVFGVRQSVNPATLEPDAVYYPYISGGKVVDCKKRLLPKRFYNITGEIKKAELFGEHTIPKKQRGMLIITEGEDDAMAVYEMLAACDKRYAVASLQNGANENGELDQSLLRRLEFITSFTAVTLCLDDDSAGRATSDALAELLAPSCEVRVIQLPEGCKDASDMLPLNNPVLFLQHLNNAQNYTPEGIIEGQDVQLEALLEPALDGYQLPYPELQRKLHGLRKAEITLLVAGTGIGKTTLARETAVHSVKQHNLTVGNIFLEEQHKKTAQGYVAIDNNTPLPALRVNPGLLTKEQWQASYDRFFTAKKAHFFKHFGSVASDRLINKMRYFALALKCDFIFLDHITMVHSGNKTTDERKDIDILMTSLAELVTETGVGVVAVVHLRRTGEAVSFNEGGEVRLTDLRGSSQLEALSWNVIALERNQQSDTVSDISTIRLLKNREWGFTGVCDKLAYHHHTGRLLAAKAEL